MKKIILIAIAFCAFGCSYSVLAEQTPLEEYTQIKQNLEDLRAEDIHFYVPVVFLNTYVDSDGTLICKTPGTKPGFFRILKKYIEPLQLITRSDIDIKCFMFKENSNELMDTSDKCILQRRNHPQPSKTCWFDYKRFLPSTSKIKTDDEFINLVKNTKLLAKYCDSQQEMTTKEREECVPKAKLFIGQLSTKTAPHCRNVVPKEYNEILQEGKDVLSFVDNTNVQNAFGQKMQFETSAYHAVYGSAFAKAITDELKKLGVSNFCTIDGFEADIKKLQKQEITKKSRNVIELN